MGLQLLGRETTESLGMTESHGQSHGLSFCCVCKFESTVRT
jgi:hypothetical protein